MAVAVSATRLQRSMCFAETDTVTVDAAGEDALHLAQVGYMDGARAGAPARAARSPAETAAV